jgi:HKD family nuclease
MISILLSIEENGLESLEHLVVQQFKECNSASFSSSFITSSGRCGRIPKDFAQV